MPNLRNALERRAAIFGPFDDQAAPATTQGLSRCAAAVASEIDKPEDADVVDVMTVLSVEARRDLLAGFGGGRL